MIFSDFWGFCFILLEIMKKNDNNNYNEKNNISGQKSFLGYCQVIL